MELTKRINFRQPKYMIPALIYFPLIFTAYFVIDAFGTKKAETVDPSMQTTEYLNPNLPQAKVKDDLDGKYESMLKSWGKIDDYSAVGNIDRDDDGAATETYERQVSEAEAEAMERKAEAYAKYGKAAVTQMIVEVLPDIAREVAAPMAAIDKVTIIGGDADGVGQMSGNVAGVMARLFETVQETTGLDLRVFEDAITFKIALMVVRYMKYMESLEY